MLGLLSLVLFGNVLAVQAYSNAEFTSDHVNSDSGDQGSVPLSVRTGGPVINTIGGQELTHRLPQRTIALTFDDGPDPAWTPRVLEILEEHDAHATFFVLGSQVARHPELVRRMVTGKHELGAHTFTHPNLTQLAPWRRRLEYSQTQMAIARAAGVQTRLLRFPYSSTASAIDDDNWPLMKEAGKLGYLVVVNDTDSQDWARPGVAEIVRNATPARDSSAIILFHDAGGDRSQTLEALRTFIPQMKARGYRFTTVTEGLNLGLAERNIAGRNEAGTVRPGTANPGSTGAGTASPAAAASAPARASAAPGPALSLNPPAARADILRGAGLLWTLRLADAVVTGLAGLFVLVGVLTVLRTGLLLLLATRHARRRRQGDFSWGPPVTEPVSVIVPAYNEKEGIAASVRSLAGGDYPEIEVIVVDDGSTDGTAAIVEALELPNVRVIRVPNGGKANALNTGISLARHDLLVMVDGDTIFESDSIRQLVQPFASPAIGAVAGNVKVGNRTSLVALWQHIEYVIGFNLDRRLYETLQCMPTVPGAIGAFRRAALREVRGISDQTLAEDTDVTMALCRAGWRIVYEERAKAWTEAPATLEQLYRQRYRWSYGTMQAMWKHRHALYDSGDSGRFGRRGLPFLALFGVALPLLAPLVDVMLVYGLIFWDRTHTLLAWSAMLLLQLFTAVVAFRFDSESLRPLLKLPLQQFVYRQLMYLVLIQSALTAMTGGRLRWHKLHRSGSVTVPSTDDGASQVDAGVPGFSSFPGQRRATASSLGIGRNVAPVVDTWPPVLGQPGPANRRLTAGRAAARPAIPRLRPRSAVPTQPGAAEHSVLTSAAAVATTDGAVESAIEAGRAEKAAVKTRGAGRATARAGTGKRTAAKAGSAKRTAAKAGSAKRTAAKAGSAKRTAAKNGTNGAGPA